jgi:hypothetical protein
VTRSVVAGTVVGVCAGLLVLFAADRLLLSPRPAASVAVAREAAAQDPAAPGAAATSPQKNWAADPIRPAAESETPALGPHAQGQAPGRDGDRTMRTVLEAHQQGLSEIVRPGLDKALFTQASDQCGIAFAGRKQRPWMLNGMLAVDLEIRGDQAVVGEVFFPPEHEGSVGDEAFRTCLRDVVAGARFECVRCKPGTLTVPYPVNLRTYRSSYPDAGP